MSDSATNKHQRCRWEGHGGLVTFGLEMFLELKETQVPHFSMLSSSFWTHSETVNESGHTMVELEDDEHPLTKNHRQVKRKFRFLAAHTMEQTGGGWPWG